MFITRSSLAGYADTRERTEMMLADVFDVLASGKVKPHIGQRLDLAKACKAQAALAARQTTGSTILLP